MSNRNEVEQHREIVRALDARIAVVQRRVASVEGGRLLGRAVANLRVVDQLLDAALRQPLDRRTGGDAADVAEATAR